MKEEITIERKRDKSEFLVKLSQEIANAVEIYCETIEIRPEQFIRNAVVKDLIRTFVNIQSEDYIYLGDKYPEVKKPLKKCLETMKLAIEIME